MSGFGSDCVQSTLVWWVWSLGVGLSGSFDRLISRVEFTGPPSVIVIITLVQYFCLYPQVGSVTSIWEVTGVSVAGPVVGRSHIYLSVGGGSVICAQYWWVRLESPGRLVENISGGSVMADIFRFRSGGMWQLLICSGASFGAGWSVSREIRVFFLYLFTM